MHRSFYTAVKWKYLCLLALSISLAPSYFSARGELSSCEAGQTAKRLPSPPWIFLGYSRLFEEKVYAAFPLGTCADRLFAWLDEADFSPAFKSSYDTGFADEPNERERGRNRLISGEKIDLRVLKVWAPIGHSYFSVASIQTKDGRLSELYADTELFQFNAP